MTHFHERLRDQRTTAGLTQAELASRLQVARSSLANVEVGRERPTPRLWTGLADLWPRWAAENRDLYEKARAAKDYRRAQRPPMTATEPFLGGPFAIESLTLTYVFEESISPSEIIEVRTVRATESGASAFGLTIGHTGSPDYVIDQQALWGGTLVVEARTAGRETEYWRRVELGRALRKSQTHEFALRTWVERDPDPQTAVVFNLTVPAKRVSINVTCLGTPQVGSAWRYGPSPYSDPDDQPPPTRADRLRVANGSCGAVFAKPETGPFHGVRWEWA